MIVLGYNELGLSKNVNSNFYKLVVKPIRASQVSNAMPCPHTRANRWSWVEQGFHLNKEVLRFFFQILLLPVRICFVLLTISSLNVMYYSFVRARPLTLQLQMHFSICKCRCRCRKVAHSLMYNFKLDEI